MPATLNIALIQLPTRPNTGQVLEAAKSDPVAIETHLTSGANAVTAIAATKTGRDGQHWEISAAGGSGLVDFGAAPDASGGSVFLIPEGETRRFAVSKVGEKCAYMDAGVTASGGGGGGGGGAGTEYTEDAAAPANPVGGMLIARRRDAPATNEVSAEGDAIALNATSKGELRVVDAGVGAQADAAYADATLAAAGGLVALLKGIFGKVAALILGAGENHIGKVGGETVVASSTPVVSAAPAYSPGDCIGGKLTFAGLGRIAGGTGLVQMASVQCKSAQTFSFDLVLFHTDPAATVFTDNAALALAAADFDKVLGVVPFGSTSWFSLGTPSFAEATALAMAYKVAAGATDLFGVVVSRGAPTLLSTSDLKVVIKGLLD